MTILHRYLPQLRKQSAGSICPSCQFYSSILEFSVIPLRFERRTHALEGRCSIQLSYGTILVICKAFSDSAAIRTQDPRLRRALLYPAELRNHP